MEINNGISRNRKCREQKELKMQTNKNEINSKMVHDSREKKNNGKIEDPRKTSSFDIQLLKIIKKS